MKPAFIIFLNKFKIKKMNNDFDEKGTVSIDLKDFMPN